MSLEIFLDWMGVLQIPDIAPNLAYLKLKYCKTYPRPIPLNLPRLRTFAIETHERVTFDLGNCLALEHIRLDMCFARFQNVPLCVQHLSIVYGCRCDNLGGLVRSIPGLIRLSIPYLLPRSWCSFSRHIQILDCGQQFDDSKQCDLTLMTSLRFVFDLFFQIKM